MAHTLDRDTLVETCLPDALSIRCKPVTDSALIELGLQRSLSINKFSSNDEKTLESVNESTFLVEFSESDSRNPINFSRRRKWLLTIIASIFTLLVSASTTSYNIGIPSMMRDLNCTQFQATLGLCVYAIGFGVFPLLSSAFSEEFGRHPLYITTLIGFLLMHVAVAVAPNIQVVIVARVIHGALGSTGSTMVAGTIADIWDPKERGLPMAVYSLVAFSGNGIGALIAGWIEINPRMEWRWIQWISLIAGAVYLIPFLWVTRETRSTVILMDIAKKMRKITGDGRYRTRANTDMRQLLWVSCKRPIQFLFTEPIVFGVSLWIGFAWGVFYCFIASIPGVFKTLHGFNSGQVGTVYLTMAVGSVLGFASNFVQERLYQKNVDKRGPEARLYFACIGSVFFPLAMFMYAWCSSKGIHWITLVLAFTIYIWATFTIYLAVFSYLADCYGTYASSALSGQSLFRNIVGGVFPMFTEQMFGALGYRWANTMFACVAIAMIPIPGILYLYGANIRRRCKFTVDSVRIQ